MEARVFSALLFLFVLEVAPSGSEESQTKILTQGQLYSQPVNTNISLPCLVRNMDGSVITWMKDDRVMSADNFKVIDDSRISVLHMKGKGSRLEIRTLKQSDSGQYSCIVNLKQKPLKVIHTLQIQVPPRIHKIHPENGSVTVRAGSRVKLECKASGQPRPTVYWNRLHNRAFPWGGGGNLTVAGETLSMSGITRLYDGEYICNADNGVGQKPVRESITLVVLYPPEVYPENDWISTGQSQTVSLICVVYSNPVARVTWYKNTMKLQDGEKIHTKHIGNTHKLVIANVAEEDFGQYSCKASNLLEKEVSRKLIVTGAPSKPLIVSDGQSNDRYSYDLSWSVSSQYPIIKHEAQVWPKYDASIHIPPKDAQIKRIKSGGGTDPLTYNIKGLQKNTRYDIRIRSQNEHGWSPYSDINSFTTLDKDKMPMEVKKPSELETLYQGTEVLKSEPVTSSTMSLSSLPNLFLPPLCVSLVYRGFG